MSHDLEKTMSLTPAEFAKSFARLDPDADVLPERRHYQLAVGTGLVEIDVTPIAPARLGGVLAMPRCTVRFTFSNTTPEEQAAFMNRFDRTFQRGGG